MSLARTMAGATRIVFDPNQIVLTDDHAPVEQMTNKMMLEYSAAEN